MVTDCVTTVVNGFRKAKVKNAAPPIPPLYVSEWVHQYYPQGDRHDGLPYTAPGIPGPHFGKIGYVRNVPIYDQIRADVYAYRYGLG